VDFGGTARDEAVGFSIANKGYIGTGRDNSNPYKQDFWEYDPVSNIWTQKADFGGTARVEPVGFSIGNKGYIGTGTGNVSQMTDFWEYIPDNSCSAPGGLKVLHVSDTCAVLTWNATGTGIVKLQLRYRALGETIWTRQSKNPDRNRAYINGLTSNTTYQWQLRSICAEDTSDWVKGPDFTTAASLSSVAKANVYPNPASNIVTVNYTAYNTGKYFFEITDISGNVLLHKEANAMPGVNSIAIDVSSLFKGAYFINIINPDKTRERMQLSKE
jgi:hypothetical protein